MGRHRHGHFGMPNFWLIYWIWGPRWRLGRPYYGHRWERTLDREDKVPFYKKVFAFVFGPDRPRPTRNQLDRSTLRLIRARRGVITTSELVEHTGLGLAEAEEEMGRLVGAYGGEPAVSKEGDVVYAFPSLMMSAHGPVTAREPNPAWMRLEHSLELTGNTTAANAAVAGMNGFNLLAAATAPWFIFPRLGIEGPLAFVGLVLVPIVFSLMFFGIPLLRTLGVKLENRRRATRNVRRVLLGEVYRAALEERGVGLSGCIDRSASRLGGQAPSRHQVETELTRLAAEFDANVEPAENGSLVYSFPAIRRQFAASEGMRRSLRLEGRSLGEIVFSTGDSESEAAARDLAAFDRELDGAGLDLMPYLPSPDRVAFEDDYAVVAFEEEMRARGVIEA